MEPVSGQHGEPGFLHRNPVERGCVDNLLLCQEVGWVGLAWLRVEGPRSATNARRRCWRGPIIGVWRRTMRIALLADIHGNRLALDAVLTDRERHGGTGRVVDVGYCVSGPLRPSERMERLETSAR